ncbi:hypothetical protein LEN26_006072 [Aphanomyces euteiches]|nr:hypothetical protein AeMF1_003350 [Aphanomyces euteiches]KAH9136610.1 hypothetical protein LEN26_006072 [Aphanomyces euteiches]KAH9152483.1 hypothetical protein AeRB84_005091 [Aphanomyces euteiches]KAH9189481.1 hypothetical protein AeNC1_008541 [Aphanomyces euteiches]
MSPQGLKERLKRTCMEHMKKNRRKILDKLRHQSTDVPSEVMDVSESICLEDLMLRGDLSHDDYIEILTDLEGALRDEVRLEELQLAEELLAAEEAWIADFEELDLHSSDFVLCPLCKRHGVSVVVDGRYHTLECSCGLSLPLPDMHDMNQDPLTRFQEAMSNVFEAHRCVCDADPSFRTSIETQDEMLDSGYLKAKRSLFICGNQQHCIQFLQDLKLHSPSNWVV